MSDLENELREASKGTVQFEKEEQLSPFDMRRYQHSARIDIHFGGLGRGDLRKQLELVVEACEDAIVKTHDEKNLHDVYLHVKDIIDGLREGPSAEFRKRALEKRRKFNNEHAGEYF